MKTLLPALACLVSLAGPAGAQTLYGSVNNGPSQLGQLYTIDKSTGMATLVGSIGFRVTGAMDTHPTTGVLYATARRDPDATPVLITIDPMTGAGTEVGPLGTVPVCFNGGLFDISFRPSDAVLFLSTVVPDLADLCECSSGSGTGGIATIDPTTGVATPVGPNGTCGVGNALAFDGSGVLHTTVTTSVYTVDASTGAISGEQTTMQEINAMELDPVSGSLYVSVRDSDNGRSLGTLDPATGAVSVIGTTIDKLDGLAFVDVENPIESSSWGRIKSEYR